MQICINLAKRICPIAGFQIFVFGRKQHIASFGNAMFCHFGIDLFTRRKFGLRDSRLLNLRLCWAFFHNRFLSLLLRGPHFLLFYRRLLKLLYRFFIHKPDWLLVFNRFPLLFFHLGNFFGIFLHRLLGQHRHSLLIQRISPIGIITVTNTVH